MLESVLNAASSYDMVFSGTRRADVLANREGPFPTS